MKVKIQFKGGKGSGNFGHSGRPGKVGGSAGKGGGVSWMRNDATGGVGASNDELDRHAVITPLSQGKHMFRPYSGSKPYMESTHDSLDSAKATAEEFLSGATTPSHWADGSKASSGRGSDVRSSKTIFSSDKYRVTVDDKILYYEATLEGKEGDRWVHYSRTNTSVLSNPRQYDEKMIMLSLIRNYANVTRNPSETRSKLGRELDL